MKHAFRASLFVALATTLVSPLMAPVRAWSSDQAPPCFNELESFKHFVSWGKRGHRLLIEAEKGCGSKWGDAYDLTEVRLTVYSGHGQVILQAKSQEGYYAAKSGKILLMNSSPISIDLNTGELTTSGLRILLTLPAEVKRK